jgi:LmbE family N-acetylglucosaminyl deacetylase
MYTMAASAAKQTSIRFEDHGAYAWLWSQAPCSWRGRVDLEFISVPLRLLQPAGTLKDPAVVSAYLKRMRTGRAVAPPVVCATERGTFYVRDGNHRYDALQEFFGGGDSGEVRVALAVPRPGFQFRYRWFGAYGTYILEPLAENVRAFPMHSSRPAEAFTGRSMVVVAHPDDETGGCGGLLQRLRNPVVVFATDGAPADDFFWKSYGSPRNYAMVRRHEAATALAVAGVWQIEFLNDLKPLSAQFQDQQLYSRVGEAFDAVCAMVRRHRPDRLIVPAYEGGHPDHDTCSFLGYLVRQRLGLAVWEMPLYHRSTDGELICQRFREFNGTELMLRLSPHELRNRELMVASYASQSGLEAFISNPVECYRPQPDYDYSRPPHPGAVNYEVWQWPISPAEVSGHFSQCLDIVSRSLASSTGWGHASRLRQRAATLQPA